ncbi:hypothetical protein D3C72_1893230 [compost metagenome]
MDNLAAHKVKGVQEALEEVGATPLYLPPYSPEFNPIELAFSKIKTFLRAQSARTKGGLGQCLIQALKLISPKDASGWIRHAGYPLPPAYLKR